MKLQLIARSLICIVSMLLAACALMSRPQPVTTLLLKLPVDDASLSWPSSIEPGAVRAITTLQSNRVLVVNDAILMQHEGLRWVDTPAVLLAEQLRVRHAQRKVGGGTEESKATLDLWLTRFNMRIAKDGDKSVEVSAIADLICADPGKSQRLSPASVSIEWVGNDAQQVASTFAIAANEMLDAVLSDAATHSAVCDR